MLVRLKARGALVAGAIHAVTRRYVRKADVTGIDISPAMIAVARARNALRCRFDLADVMKLPFLNASFDVVSAMTVLEFVADTHQACAEMIRCVKSAGRLIVGALNRLARVNRLRVAARSEPYASAQMFTLDDLCKLLMPFGAMKILLTMEGKDIPCQKLTGSSTVKRVPAPGAESGAFITVRVMKP